MSSPLLIISQSDELELPETVALDLERIGDGAYRTRV